MIGSVRTSPVEACTVLSFAHHKLASQGQDPADLRSGLHLGTGALFMDIHGHSWTCLVLCCELCCDRALFLPLSADIMLLSPPMTS